MTNYVLTLWEHTTVLVKKGTEWEAMEKLASVSHYEEFYSTSPELFPPSFCSRGAKESTYSLIPPVLSSQMESFLSLLFSLLQFQLCACCFSPSLTMNFFKWPQRILPFSGPLPWLSSSNSFISLINPGSVVPSFTQHVESRHFPVWS